jgi:hypothetical protein
VVTIILKVSNTFGENRIFLGFLHMAEIKLQWHLQQVHLKHSALSSYAVFTQTATVDLHFEKRYHCINSKLLLLKSNISCQLH